MSARRHAPALLLVAALAGLPAAPATAQPETTAPTALSAEQLALAEQASQALREGRIDEARASIARWESDDEAQGRAASFQRHYWRGAVELTAAGRAEGPAREQGLAAAAAAFGAALALRPGHDRVALGLASVARLRGDLAEAERWYTVAATSEGRRPEVAAFNHMRLAEFLRDTGRSRDALAWSARAVALLPEGASVLELHTQLLMRDGGALALARWLHERQRAGATVFAARTALRSLPALGSDPLSARWSLLLVAVVSMARDPALTNVGIGVPPALRDAFDAAREAGALAPALAQLRAQLERPRPAIGDVPAWRALNPDPVTGVAPRTALRMLATTRARDPRDPGLAEQWWRLAVELGERGPDPEAFVGLVAHLAAHGRTAAALPELMTRYEGRLFEQKGSAYSEANWALVFRMHMALGMAYASLGRWTSADSPYRNAVFQLEAAQRAAEMANRESDPRRRPAEPLAVPAAGLDMLALGLRATGQPARALDVQLAGAERLQQLGRYSDASAVVQSLSKAAQGRGDQPATPLPAAQQIKLERLQRLVPPR